MSTGGSRRARHLLWLALPIFLAATPRSAAAQAGGPSDNPLTVTGSFSATNNGFSFIPAFTLGRPAGIFYLSLERNGFSFNTDVRYALEGRPWSISFISRKRVYRAGRAEVSVGLYYPGLSFTEARDADDPGSVRVQVEQSVSPEVNLSLRATPILSVGTNYMYYRGIGAGSLRNGHYVAAWTNLGGVDLGRRLRLSASGQLFYLDLDGTGGYYGAANVVLSKQEFPVSLSSMMSKTLDSQIPSQDFNWNVSVTYRFSASFVKR
jgi:hypothetical protein